MHRVAKSIFPRRQTLVCRIRIVSQLVASKGCEWGRAMSVSVVSEASAGHGAEDRSPDTAKHAHRSNDFGPDDINVDWGSAAKVWDKVAVAKELPAFVVGDGKYGITDLDRIQEIGESGEFLSNSSMYNRHRTFAICVGYTGTAYEFGYQRQKYKDEAEPVTVEVCMFLHVKCPRKFLVAILFVSCAIFRAVV